MANRQDDWEKLVHIAEEYEPDPDLGTRTVRELERSPVKKRKKWPLYRWLSIAACCPVVVGLSVFLPVYFSSRNEIIYYSSEEIEATRIDDIKSFEEESDVRFHYFSGDMVSSQVGRIIESKELAYISQEMVRVGGMGVDVIELYVVFMPNARFSFLEDYESISDLMTVSDVAVSYYIRQSESTSECLAKLTYENVDYYMTITTSNGSTETIENYVELLLGI